MISIFLHDPDLPNEHIRSKDDQFSMIDILLAFLFLPPPCSWKPTAVKLYM